MKLRLLFVFSLFACWFIAPQILAQQTETPTSNSTPGKNSDADNSSAPPPAASESSATAKAYPTPGVSATRSPKAATPSPSAASKVSPTPAGKQANAAPAAARPLTGSAESQIRQIEDAYEAATLAHNVALVESYMADDLVYTNAHNQVMNKRGTLAYFKKDTDTYTTAKNTELKLHKIDNDVYVVTGVAHEVGKDKAGKAFDRRYRFTDTFANRGGKWQTVASHVSLLSGQF
jgi:ketosteroid isomerase-like protein